MRCTLALELAFQTQVKPTNKKHFEWKCTVPMLSNTCLACLGLKGRNSCSEPYLDLTDVGEIVLVAVDVIPMILLSPLVCSECLDAVVNLGKNDTSELSTRGHVRHSSGIEVHDVFNQLVITPIFKRYLSS